MHTKEALEGGDSEARVKALKHWQNSDLFDPREKAALAWAEVLTRTGSQAEIEFALDHAARKSGDKTEPQQQKNK